MGAVIALFLTGYLLKTIFVLFLMCLAIYLLCKKTSMDSLDPVHPIEKYKIKYSGFVIGFIASMIGSAGGILMVPFLRKLNYPMRQAVGTSTMIGLPISLTAAIIYTVLGLIKMPISPVTIGYLHWPALLAITISGLFSARLGVKFATKLSTVLLQRVFACMMLIVGLKMLN